MNSDIAKILKKSKKIILVFVIVTIFYAVLVYVLFMQQPDPLVDPQAGIMTDASYQEYKEDISSTNKGVKALLEGEQLKQIEFYDIKEIEVRISGKENPFGQSF